MDLDVDPIQPGGAYYESKSQFIYPDSGKVRKHYPCRRPAIYHALGAQQIYQHPGKGSGNAAVQPDR